MLKSFKRFLRDERGNVTIESLVVIGGSVWMMGVVVGDISVATMGVTERIENRLEYSSIVNDILSGYGPESDLAGGSDGGSDSGSDDDTGSDDEVDCVGNPGNDKCVGNAGENPNGGEDWGSGSNGMSDSGSTGSSNSGSSSPGNSGNAPGKNK